MGKQKQPLHRQTTPARQGNFPHGQTLFTQERRVQMTDKNKNEKRTQKEIDDQLDDSFPASDPPSWMPGTTKEADEDAKLKVKPEDKKK
jgi:hypothetical protein